MSLKKNFTLAILFISTLAVAQNKKLLINPQIRLPKDSLKAQALIMALDNFLDAAQQPTEANNYVLPSEKVETFIQLDEIYGIEKSEKYMDTFFYKPYLTNLVALENNKFLIKVAYIGVSQNVPILAGNFEFIAHRLNDNFLFSSPLKRNTQAWKAAKVGNNIFYYKQSINKANVKKFEKLAATFDHKLKVTDKVCEFYLTENFVDLQNLIGVDYKMSYNGYEANTLSASYNNKKVIVLGSNSATFDSFDPHDLWHDRLSLVISRRQVNKPIDEGCAYLYGGSWGMSWPEILSMFKTKVCIDAKKDWLADYGKFENFGTSDATHLMAEYVLNALFVQKIEQEKGFEGVWQFLNCGTYEKSNEKYFDTLEKLTGISKTNFNAKVWELIQQAK